MCYFLRPSKNSNYQKLKIYVHLQSVLKAITFCFQTLLESLWPAINCFSNLIHINIMVQNIRIQNIVQVRVRVYCAQCTVLRKTQKGSVQNESQCGSSEKSYQNQRLSVMISVKAWSETLQNLRILHVRPVNGRTKIKWKKLKSAQSYSHFRFYVRAPVRGAISIFPCRGAFFSGPDYPLHPVQVFKSPQIFNTGIHLKF